jgi:hypothetical protein
LNTDFHFSQIYDLIYQKEFLKTILTILLHFGVFIGLGQLLKSSVLKVFSIINKKGERVKI